LRPTPEVRSIREKPMSESETMTMWCPYCCEKTEAFLEEDDQLTERRGRLAASILSFLWMIIAAGGWFLFFRSPPSIYTWRCSRCRNILEQNHVPN
jgi:hypothetical protein